MVTKPRWQMECVLMDDVFPAFRPFSQNGMIGFQGKLPGPHTGRVFTTILTAPARSYPERQPAVFVSPRPEPHHWLSDGRLCVERTWQPARNTFANMLLIVVKYIAEFD